MVYPDRVMTLGFGVAGDRNDAVSAVELGLFHPLLSDGAAGLWESILKR